MVDVASVVSAIQGIKVATEIVQSIRTTDKSLAAAEHKLALADLVSALADAKIALSTVQEEMHEKDKEIARLKEALILRKKLIRSDDAYYESTEEGFPIGDAYCSHCFEVKGIAIHLHTSPANRLQSICPLCKNIVHHAFKKDGSKPNS